jgi:hypothetical protein
MASESQQRMDALKATSAKRVLMEYFKERLIEHQSKLTKLSKDTFDVHKGQCLELESILSYLES